MRDVAARAGVSPVVVSRVLHNKAASIRVSEATAARVRQAAKDLGYRCNVFARNFRAGQTMTIGVLHGVGFAPPVFSTGSRYFCELMDGVIEGAFARGYSVTLCPKLLGQSPEDAMSDGRFDGLIWYSTIPSERNWELLQRCTVPLVLIHGKSAHFGHKFPSVICDNSQGIGLAVDHLMGLGHRKIGFALEGHVVSSETALRLGAFREHMARHGCNVLDEDVLDCRWGGHEIEEFLRSRKHTAVVAHHDGLAAQFLEAAPKVGVRIPEDFSIVGFDSTAYCDELKPALTSVLQPLKTMGERAIDLLVQAIAGECPHGPELILPCGLDVRDSTTSVCILVNKP